MKFRRLRETEWHPTFEWVKTSLKCADKINSYHEDYPKYVGATNTILQEFLPSGQYVTIPNRTLLYIHKSIFIDKPFAGRWRNIDVRVGLHRPPQFLDIAELMDELYDTYTIVNIEKLIEWYADFETIHPFQDGNGRVGGVIVAVYSHALRPTLGWLAPNQ